MPGTFGYTESTNIAVVTGGTAGSPANFLSFVTADRAGIDTDLLIAGSPASDLALTYAVRPVEDLALLVKCVVANKSAEADFIFITGKDWRGAIQTESIDITAGNGSYTTTKYWSEIATLDCSDNANGGGTVWADGDLSVTQDIWGVIWDWQANSYRIDCLFIIGDGATSTYFKTAGEQLNIGSTVTVVQYKSVISVLNAATFQCGDLISTTDKTGNRGIQVLDNISTSLHNWVSNIDGKTSGIILIYGSSAQGQATRSGIGVSGTAGASSRIWNYQGQYFNPFTDIDSDVDIYRATISRDLALSNPGASAVLKDIFCISPTVAIYVSWGSAGERIFDSIIARGTTGAFSISVRNLLYTAVLLDCDLDKYTISWQLPQSESIIDRRYRCNIHISDKNGANLSGVTVACIDKDNNSVFSVSTDANGDITEQRITYIRYTYSGGTVTTTYSPHKFTISKAGYKTLVLEAIIVDRPIDWHLVLDNPIGAFAKPFVR